MINPAVAFLDKRIGSTVRGGKNRKKSRRNKEVLYNGKNIVRRDRRVRSSGKFKVT
jgi:hypothetical protein